jgi:dihydrofolate reductase
VIGVIWAQAANGVIGRDNAIPWHLPEDLAHFREVTGTATVLMGRRTWESLPPRFRPLPRRRNLVLTRDRDWRAAGAEPVADLDLALDAADGDVWVIGGADVYTAALPRADVIELTELGESFAGDVRAPALPVGWRLQSSDPATGWHESRTGLHYRWLRYLARSEDHIRLPTGRPTTGMSD